MLSSSSNKQFCVGRRPVDWCQLGSEIVDVSVESQMRKLLKTSFETINRVGCHHIFRQRIPKVHYPITQNVSSYCRFYSASACLAMQSAVLVMIDCLSDRLPHAVTLVSCQNDSSYHHAAFIVGYLHDSGFLTVNFAAKFQREHGERGRRMTQG